MFNKEKMKVGFSQSGIKIVLIFFLILLFLIPISYIKGMINDRQNYQNKAVASITEPLGGKPEIQGIVIAIPFKTYTQSIDKNDVKHIEINTKYIYFAPDLYSLDIAVNPYYLNRGIFKVPVFNGEIALESKFDSFDVSHFKISEKNIMRDEAIIMLGLSSTKNLTTAPMLKIDGNYLPISPIKYDSITPFKSTVYYDIPEKYLEKGFSLNGKLNIQGGEDIKIQPIGSDNIIKMNSAWPTPGFSGGWLPASRKITDSGFTAQWNIAGLSTVFPKSWISNTDYNGESIKVSFITPVDTYQKTTRSIKYSLLFLIIPFLSIFICEIFSNIRVHPVQYCLIGFADIMFYLILLSTSEHISFNISYLIGAVCVSATTLFYAATIFKKIKWGLLLSGVQIISYGFLYGTLQTEDYALLIGSIGLFIVVVLLMFITRKVDWYGIGQQKKE
jgi:inner membrane protein